MDLFLKLMGWALVVMVLAGVLIMIPEMFGIRIFSRFTKCGKRAHDQDAHDQDQEKSAESITQQVDEEERRIEGLLHKHFGDRKLAVAIRCQDGRKTGFENEVINLLIKSGATVTAATKTQATASLDGEYSWLSDQQLALAGMCFDASGPANGNALYWCDLRICDRSGRILAAAHVRFEGWRTVLFVIFRKLAETYADSWARDRNEPVETQDEVRESE